MVVRKRIQNEADRYIKNEEPNEVQNVDELQNELIVSEMQSKEVQNEA